MSNFVSRYNVCFSDGFQSVNPPCVLLADLHDFAEGAFANDAKEFKIFDRERRVLMCRLIGDLNLESTASSCGGVPLLGHLLLTCSKYE